MRFCEIDVRRRVAVAAVALIPWLFAAPLNGQADPESARPATAPQSEATGPDTLAEGRTEQDPPVRIVATGVGLAAVVAPPELPSLLPYAVAYDERQPRRQTRRGAKLGAIAGTAGGLVVGSLIALLCRSEGDQCDAAIPYVTVLGGVSGAVAGAIIGAAIPAEGADAPPVAAEPAAPDVDRRIGSVSLAVGPAHGRVEDLGNVVWLDAGGVAARLNVYAELRPWLAIGPEGGMAWFDDQRIRHVAVAVRTTWPRGRLAPYISGNLGAYQSTGPSLEYLGGGIGVGARWHLSGGRAFVDADARVSGNVQNIEPTRMRGLYFGGGMYW